MWLIHLLATGLLAHLPLQCRDTAGGASTEHKANGRISHLDLVWNIKYLDLSIELLGLTECSVFLVNHDITTAWHVVLIQTLDVQAYIVTRVCLIVAGVVHLHRE